MLENVYNMLRYIYNMLANINFNVIWAFFTALLAAWVTSYFNNKFFNKKFMLERVYKIHRSLLKKLTLFLYQFEIIYDIEGYQFDEKVKENIKKGINMKYQDYENELKSEIDENSPSFFPWVSEIKDISSYIKELDKWIVEIEEISYLSNSKIRKLAKDIVEKYYLYKLDEDNLLQNLGDEVDINNNPDNLKQNYIRLKLDVNSQSFWVNMYPKIKKLQKKLEQFVALK